MSSRRYYKRQSHDMDNSELRGYGEERRRLYPETYRNLHPSEETEAGYNEYKKHTEDANQSIEAYNTEYERVARDDDIHTLEGYQHQGLLLPSAEAALNTSTNASSRDAFLRDHPYAYANQRKRRRHEQLLDQAYDEAEYYRGCYETHHDGAGDYPDNLQSGRTGVAMDPEQPSYNYDDVNEVVEDEVEDYDHRYAEIVDSSDEEGGGEGEGYNQMYGGAGDNAVNNYFEGEVQYGESELVEEDGNFYVVGGGDDGYYE